MAVPVASIPVTVIGGYLGAGKTTLVNAILRGDHGKKIAVLVNDFGEVNIDASLIASDDGTTIELTNGCACCVVSDNLAESFHAVAANEPRFDHVVLEASGVSDPERLARWATLPGFHVDGVIVLADAETIRKRAVDRYVGATVLQQIRSADLVVLTKTDLAGADIVDGARRWLSDVVPRVPVVCSSGDVGHEIALGSHLRGAMTDEREIAGIDHASVHVSFTLRFDRPFDPLRLPAVFASAPNGLIRAKGFVSVAADDQEREGSPQTRLLHVVGQRVALTSPPDTAAGEAVGISPGDAESVIVVIGIRAELDREAVRVALDAALV